LIESVYNIRHAPSTGLSGTQFSTINSAGINNPEGKEKYNNTEVKYWATSYSCHKTAKERKLKTTN
jgi:hypothetical protein